MGTWRNILPRVYKNPNVSQISQNYPFTLSDREELRTDKKVHNRIKLLDF